MPYFSFSLKQNLFIKKNVKIQKNIALKANNLYFSKNTYLYKFLNKKNLQSNINQIHYEKRKKIEYFGKKILFCLPPNIGLGDSIEYALAIKAIILKKKFDLVGVAFIGRYKNIFKKYFQIHNIHEEVISKDEMDKFDTIYHFSLELDEFRLQKFIRSNIEKVILNKFSCKQYRNMRSEIKIINKLTIFPISQSPIRSLSVDVIEKLIEKFSKKFDIEIILDENSVISKYIEKNIDFNNCIKLKPRSIEKLCDIVENIDFGIFPDSGPLHLAKILGKKGILIVTSVDESILLDNFTSISSFKNNYSSNFCCATCGLTNIFNYKNQSGCFDSLSVNLTSVVDKNINSLQRGSLKDKYLDFIKNPVACIKNINIDNLINQINIDIGN